MEASVKTTPPPHRSRTNQLLCFQAAYSPEQMCQAEANATKYDAHRRLMLVSLTQSGEEMLASFREEDPTAELLRSAVESMNAYLQHLEDMREATRRARARLLAVAQVLAREHGISVAA